MIHMKIGFIGAGKVGCSLAKYFQVNGYCVAGFYSLTYLRAEQAAKFTCSQVYTELSSLVNDCDCLLITVPDSQIANVWDALCLLPIDNKLIGHCSGLFTSQLFRQAQSVYPFGFSLHPLYAIHDRFNSYQSFGQVHFTLEATDSVTHQLLSFFQRLANPIAIISAEQKPLYHAACVMLSNQVIALAQIGSDMLKQCGLDEHFSEHAWHQLFIGNANTVCQSGTKAALTGPVERGDIATIKQHLAVIPPEVKPIYQHLSLVLLEISQQKHPQRDYQQLHLELSF